MLLKDRLIRAKNTLRPSLENEAPLGFIAQWRLLKENIQYNQSIN
ncbi:hypothetical protein LDG_9074 [Legionella drancourtii LLAP12]|uniref:Uncharacterized protein n=1 Tax=Legionella drancourtii LLAP12 TaxID=658187 RepID=G9EUS4_9GAMM|nr:hypothetical protein LDG_9074 [Legionella drancourtii LLAP12]